MENGGWWMAWENRSPPPSGGLAGAAIQGIGQASKGCQTEGARGGQKDERLQGQQGKSHRGGRLDLDACLDQQGEQQDHSGLQAGDLRGGEGAERAEGVGEELGGKEVGKRGSILPSIGPKWEAIMVQVGNRGD